MRKILWLPSAAILMAGILVIISPKPAAAKPDWTKKERKQCVYCHVGSWDSGKYTEPGQYYKTHEYSFRGYVPKTGTDSAKVPAAAKKTDDKH
jgi:hypothetical protein